MLEGGKHGAGVMPDMSAGMDQGAMPKVAVADTSECVAEGSQLMAERSQRLAAGVKPKAARQSGDLYDVVIQCVWPGIGPEGNAGDSWHTKPVRTSVEAQSQDGQCWW